MTHYIKPEENKNKILVVSRDENLTKIIKHYVISSKGSVEVHEASTDNEILKKMFGHDFDSVIVSRKDEDLIKGVKGYEGRVHFIEDEKGLKEELAKMIYSHIK